VLEAGPETGVELAPAAAPLVSLGFGVRVDVCAHLCKCAAPWQVGHLLTTFKLRAALINMSNSSTLSRASFLCLAALITGCGLITGCSAGSGDGDGSGGVSASGGSGGAGAGAAASGGAGGSGGVGFGGKDPACKVEPTYGDVTLNNAKASGEGGPTYRANLNAEAEVAGAPDVSLRLLMPTVSWPDGVKTGTFDMTGDETNLATCTVCLFLDYKINADGQASHFVNGGTVEITKLDTEFTAVFKDLTFVHSDYALSPPYASTPHADGCTSHIKSATLAAPILNEF